MKYAFCKNCGRTVRTEKAGLLGLVSCAAAFLFLAYSGGFFYEYAAVSVAAVICASNYGDRCFMCRGRDLSPYEDPFKEKKSDESDGK